MEKLKVGKYKDYTFQNAKNKILEDDPNYINYLKSYLTQNRKEDLKKNIKSFIEYFDNKNVLFFKKPEEEFIPKISIIQNDSQKITHLIHLSDIHIRLYKRSQEYLKVFQETYENIKKIKGNKLIVITGDILHYKNQLSPECIILTQEFLLKLSQISPVILIAGNHDALLTNQQRVDSISAIINHAQIPNLHYLKDTGIYQYNNLAFAVNSLLDNHWIYEKNIPEIEVDYKIALYHGGVGQVDTGVGYRLRGEKLVSDFDGYDYVLLGDIHKHQFLTPTMAYAGSLISQNFNEWSYPHGFLIWDLYQNKKKFIKIKNQCGYFIFTIKNDHLFINDDIITVQDIPHYFLDTTDTLEIKLLIQNSTSEYIDFVCEKLRTCATDVKIYFSYLTENQNEYEFQGENIETDFIEILTKLLKEKFNITDENEIKYLLDKYEELVKENPQLEDKTLNRWEILDLEFSNMFGYGENNFIDFSRFNDHTVVGLFANNGYGKSSLIDIILFTLFGKISRFQGNGVSKDIINIQKTKFNSKIRFKIGSQVYIIEKEGKREQSGKIKIIKENFFKMEDENIINLVDESRIKTDKLIVKEIGTFEEFIFTNIQLQNRDKSFKDMTMTERKEYLYKVFKLNFFEEIIKILSGTLKEISADVLLLKKSSSPEFKNQIKNEIEEFQNQEISLKEQIEDHQNQEQILTKSIHQLLEKTAKINHLTPEKIKSHQSKSHSLKAECQNHQTSLQKKITDIKNFNLQEVNIQKLEEQQHQLQKEIRKLNKESLIPTKHLLKKISQEPFSHLIQQKKELRTQRGTLAPNPELNKWEEELQGIKIYDIGKVDIKTELPLKNKELKVVKQKIKLYEEEVKDKVLIKSKLEKMTEEVEENKRIKEKIKLNEKLIKKIKEHEFNPDCEFCVRNPIVQEGKKAEKENILLKEQLTETSEKEVKEEKKKLEEILEKEKKLIQKKSKLEVLNNQILDLEEKNKLMEENLKNEKVVNELKEKIKEEKKKLEKILKLDKEIENLEEQIDIRMELEEIEKKNQIIESKNQEIDVLIKDKVSQEEELKHQIKNYHSQTLKLTKLKSSYNEELNQLEIKEKELKVILEDLSLLDEENVNDLTQIETSQKELKILQKELNNFYAEKGKIEEKIRTNQEKLEDLETNFSLLEEKEKEYGLIKVLERALGKDGMPLFLLNQYLPLITENVNMIIAPFLEREVEIKLDGDKILFESFNKHCREKSVQIHGGMESFMMDLAFKITIGKFAKMPKGDVLFIDEGISALDKDKISNIDTLFEFLKNHFRKIILITHIDTVKDSIIEKIEIEKVNNLSQIKCLYSN